MTIRVYDFNRDRVFEVTRDRWRSYSDADRRQLRADSMWHAAQTLGRVRCVQGGDCDCRTCTKEAA